MTGRVVDFTTASTRRQRAELGLPQMVVAIHYGRTEQGILDDFRKHGMQLREVE